MSVPDFLKRVGVIRLTVPFSVSSWIRTPKHNDAVGGKPKSKHLSGEALDAVLDDHKRANELISLCKKAELVCADEGDHVHIQTP